jgi:hypothetical protein
VAKHFTLAMPALRLRYSLAYAQQITGQVKQTARRSQKEFAQYAKAYLIFWPPAAVASIAHDRRQLLVFGGFIHREIAGPRATRGGDIRDIVNVTN